MGPGGIKLAIELTLTASGIRMARSLVKRMMA